MGRILTDFGKTVVALGRVGTILETEDEYERDGAAASAIPDAEAGAAPSAAASADGASATAGFFDGASKPFIPKGFTLSGRVEFRDLRFAYPGEKPVLNGVTFTVEPGQTVAILGKTGSGKSSLVALLARFNDPSGGELLLDGHDIRGIPRDLLREQVGVILQEPFLFSRSFEGNLRLARPDAEMHELEAAAKAACLEPVLAGLEAGWETMVGEDGVTLSGGQRQRAAIARMLLRKPRILVMDDSLSAVDTETDAFIRRELEKRRGGMTVIIIAHRVTTLAAADKIVVLENGRVADEGTHGELMARPGLYRRVGEIQANMKDAI